jgi:hypothetical protein
MQLSLTCYLLPVLLRASSAQAPCFSYPSAVAITYPYHHLSCSSFFPCPPFPSPGTDVRKTDSLLVSQQDYNLGTNVAYEIDVHQAALLRNILCFLGDCGRRYGGKRIGSTSSIFVSGALR